MVACPAFIVGQAAIGDLLANGREQVMTLAMLRVGFR